MTSAPQSFWKTSLQESQSSLQAPWSSGKACSKEDILGGGETY